MSKKRILLVDDEEDLVYAVKIQLENNGYEVLVAVDGQDGLEKARHTRVDLIILDLMLPKMNGYQVCRMLKFDEKYKDIPVILFTSRTQKNDEKVGYEVGANAYITKPFEPAILLDKVARLINHS
jgi:DNA-binding response OmpR family regulator